MKDLNQDILTNNGPQYEDPFIAAAYQIFYHLRHSVMAFIIYGALFEKISIPLRIFICDIGAGSDAGLIGLMLALKRKNANPHVRYISIEPSDAMYESGRFFCNHFQYLQEYKNIDYCRFRGIHELSDIEKHKQNLNIVTAFHMNLKYGEDYNLYPDSIQVNALFKTIMDSVYPDIYLFTCPKNKTEHLKNILDNINSYKQYNISFPGYSYSVGESLQKLYSHLGFKFPKNYTPRRSPGTVKSRFNAPYNTMLHYGWVNGLGTKGRDAAFEPDDDLPF